MIGVGLGVSHFAREHPRMDAEYKYSDKYSKKKAEEKVENRKSEPRSRE
jgi:hypothetical protein